MKLQIKFSTNDKSISIPIVGRNNMLGYDDNVENLVNSQTNQAINNVSDAEVRRFKPSTSYNIRFLFYNGSSYVQLIAPTEFTNSDIGTSALAGSFYIIQLYDVFDGNTQKKYHTGYYNGYDFTDLDTNYVYNSDLEFSNLYLTQDLIDSLSGVSKTFYVRFSFYSAKSGKFYSFFNDNTIYTTEQKLYHTITINPLTFTYTYAAPSSPITLKEVLNSDYNTLINNTASSVNIEKPVYPAGNTFTTDGTYISV